MRVTSPSRLVVTKTLRAGMARAQLARVAGRFGIARRHERLEDLLGDPAVAAVIVDCGAGYGEPLHVMRCVREIENAGAAGLHIEDQIFPKRVHYHQGIEHTVTREELVMKIKYAVAARSDPNFMIMGRTDAMKTLTPAEWAQVPGDVVRALVNGFVPGLGGSVGSAAAGSAKTPKVRSVASRRAVSQTKASPAPKRAVTARSARSAAG